MQADPKTAPALIRPDKPFKNLRQFFAGDRDTAVFDSEEPF
jgi:hypothetical protein